MNPRTRKMALDALGRLEGRIQRLESEDARLDPVSPGKTLVLPAVWDGNIKPRLDRLQDDIRELLTPFALGRTLTAEPAPRALDLGRVWDGIAELERLVRDAKANAAGDEREDESERAAAVIRGHLEGNTRDGRPGFINGLMGSRHHVPGDGGGAAPDIAGINAAHRSHWAERNAVGSRSAASDAGNRSAFRDKGAAAHVRDRVRQINQAARSFWRGRTPQS